MLSPSVRMSASMLLSLTLGCSGQTGDGPEDPGPPNQNTGGGNGLMIAGMGGNATAGSGGQSTAGSAGSTMTAGVGGSASQAGAGGAPATGGSGVVTNGPGTG